MPCSRQTHSLSRHLRRQHGAVLIVMLVIMMMGIATVLISSLSTTALKTARQETTVQALAQAKEALIGYAVTNTDTGTDYPLGNLPCPDTDNDGSSDAGGSTECPQYIGRLPWKTLGLPDLRDAAGERLWYTLSRNVRRYTSVRPINSETTGTLNISGNYSASNQIAIVFAPGSPVSGQSRSSSQTALCITTDTTIAENRCASNYLEGSNANPSPGATPNQSYQSSDASISFNDQLISISRDHFFQQVEKRVGNEIKKILNTYYSAWGAYPFAPPFSNPSTSFFTGAIGTYNGLLPIGNNTLPTWGAIPTVSISGGAITGGPMDCLLSNDVGGGNYSRWRCCDTGGGSSCTSNNITIPAGVTVTITGTLNNVGLGFWRPHHTYNVCEVRAKNSSGSSVQATSILNNVSVTGSLNSNGSAAVVFRATGKSGGTTLQRIELRDISSYNTDIKTYSDSSNCSSPSSSSPVIPKWLFNDATYGNNWHQFAYYAVSSGHTQSGGACTPLPGAPPSCLTVDGSSGGNDKRAVVVMTGNALTGQSRAASPNALCPATGTTIAPNDCLSNYLELENATPADFIYENKARSSTFNDQVIIVAP